MRLAGLLSTDSLLANVLFPADPRTGERRRPERAEVISEPEQVDAFFARLGGGS